MQIKQPDGFPKIQRRSDGWYVDVAHDGGIYSAGPASKETAEQIVREVNAEIAEYFGLKN